ncbi:MULTISPECIES: rhodanese-like domain-containing protein [Thioclava]|uniref:Rhodanese-like domain-containing protein n=1 Tax=Thioclava electrotropha TaxID=1549850 RepID=A0ABX6YWE0_9RHOB|nr:MULTISPECIES: rhodanese-like domain-containing protein [Thioclava]MPQ93186.1 rhodanese-like domain-containing protein [Thioclava sp. JE_KL1]OOY10160.1 sulfurtransferase [Thioclava sp. F36-7]OOY19699.1 sulfurtransferase [Thioclava sp. DLFJ5-1]QPZ92041.1 rhodanese-like domain-containing protein [Thioclava electrotropha]
MRFIFLAALLAAAPVLVEPAFAEPVNIRPDVMSVTVDTAKGPVEIKRIQDNENKLEGDWAKTSRPCPSFCIQPMIPAPGVTPVGELEMLEFLKDPNVVVVDGRVTRDFEGGAIPGAINIPYMEAPDRLGELGCQPDFEGFICDGEDVKSVALYCNGPWCGQSPTAARRMIEAGFPAEKIYYYRGGMQQWRLLGLTVSGG